MCAGQESNSSSIHHGIREAKKTEMNMHWNAYMVPIWHFADKGSFPPCWPIVFSSPMRKLRLTGSRPEVSQGSGGGGAESCCLPPTACCLSMTGDHVLRA